MNLIKNIAFASLLACTSGCLSASAQLSLPTKTVNNQSYYYYKVKSKETIYGISKRLDISIDDLLKYNPSARNGLKADQLLLLPVSVFGSDTDKANATKAAATASSSTSAKVANSFNNSSKATTSTKVVSSSNVAVKKPNLTPSVEYYTVRKGDSIFGIAKEFSTTVDDIFEQNPGVSPSSFAEGQVIKLNKNSLEPVLVETARTSYTNHVVQKKETLFGIAKTYKVNIDDLQRANNGITEAKRGTTIKVPIISKEHSYANPYTLRNEMTYSELSDIYNKVHASDLATTTNVAVILPFMLNEEKPSKQALQYTEFYKGFLMAVDSVSKTATRPIKISVFDNKNSLAATDSILALPALRSMNCIVAPSANDQLKAVADFGKDNNVNVLNMFSVKNEEYQNNPYLFQANTPTATMNKNVIQWFKEQFEGRTVYILQNPNEEPKDIISDLIAECQASGFNVITLPVDKSFSLNEVITSDSQCVFVPTCGSQSFFKLFAHVIERAKREYPEAAISLLAYPEYISYLTHYRDQFKALDTYIYSRFYMNTEADNSRDVDNAYKNWYGENMRYVAPRMGALGFDAGMFVFNYMLQNSNKNKMYSYEGVQSTFSMERVSNWGGYCNSAIDIIHFSQFGSTDKIHFPY